jgi:hypothetical protein
VTSSTTPQDRAVELSPEVDRAIDVIRELTGRKDERDEEVIHLLADAGLLSSGTQEGDGSLRSEPSATGRVWTHDDPEPGVNPDLNFPAVVDKHGIRWVADERQDGFEGWRTDSHGLVVWRTWFELAFNRGPLTEEVPRG